MAQNWMEMMKTKTRTLMNVSKRNIVRNIGAKKIYCDGKIGIRIEIY